MARVKTVKKPLPAQMFLVMRVSWSVCLLPKSRTVCYSNDGEDATPIAVFSSQAAAEAHAAELEQQARRELSPFLFLDLRELDHISSHPVTEWRRRLKTVGLNMPTKKAFNDGSGEIDWQAWYDSLVETLTDEQRRVLWGLCDQLSLYKVMAINPEGQADE